jgi:ribose 5-phosphate isomerase A
MISEDYIEKFLEDKLEKNTILALGTSSTSHKVLKKLAVKNILQDYNIKLIPSSLDIAQLAKEYEIDLVEIKNADLVIEFASNADIIYNYAKTKTQSLIRDKVIAYHAKEVIVFIEKENYNLRINEFPVEVDRFGIDKTLNALRVFGEAEIRHNEKGQKVKTLTQNYLIDMKVSKEYSYDDLEFKIKEIPGVLETGLFLGYADKIFSVDKRHNIKEMKGKVKS